MKAAIDVYYHDKHAKAAAVLFNDWSDAEPAMIKSAYIENVADYEPGAFYKRELPCIMALLKSIEGIELDLLIVDGYVYLDKDMKPGLGGHLYSTINRQMPVIGVAKSFFSENKYIKPIYRNGSKNPLYISAAGIDLDEAAQHIATMHGSYRMPTLLKIMDRESRT